MTSGAIYNHFSSKAELLTAAISEQGPGAISDLMRTGEATSVLDAFHVVKLGSQVVDEVRRRVQQTIHGHRGRKNDPLYRIRNLLRCAE